MYKFKEHQSGTALIICLMLLTISTIVALNAVSSTVLEEKMAGNIRNQHLAFQSAEAALRDGEQIAEALPDVASIYNGVAGLYPRTQPGDVQGSNGAYATYPVWEYAPTWATADTLPPMPGSVTPANAEYVIEDFGSSCIDDCSAALNLGNHSKQFEVKILRITARGTGLNTNQPIIIQSTYKQQ